MIRANGYIFILVILNIVVSMMHLVKGELNSGLGWFVGFLWSVKYLALDARFENIKEICRRNGIDLWEESSNEDEN